MEPKKVNITLNNEQYELLLQGLLEAQESLDKRILRIVSLGGKAPNLDERATAFCDLCNNIQSQIETQL